MKIHLIANSHIDPMWLWEWEDGCAAAISTFRTAADFCEKYNALVFNHNEALLYEWVRSYAPDLFERIQKLEAQKKWIIAGGWYLQPDCNMPSGESIIRQIIQGNEFFHKYFKHYPDTAMNLDSFGHSRGLVPILRDAGYIAYYICRPRDEYCDMSVPDRFIWKGRDGSEIPVIRDPEGYSTGAEGTSAKIVRVLKSGKQKNFENILIFWGIGDHGGGISKKDYEELERFIADSELEIIQSDFDLYAKDFLAEEKNLPVIESTLGNSMTGCYTSQIRIKQKHRELESLFYAVEQMATTCYAQNLMEYPQEQLNRALKDLLLIEFHDAIPGSSIRNVEESALRIADHAIEELIRLRLQCFFKLAQGQEKAEHRVYPILVYNPHPYDIEEIVTCEYTMAEQNWEPHWTEGRMTSGGHEVECQWEQQASGMMIDWQKRVTFLAKLKAGQITRFDIKEKIIPHRKEFYPMNSGDYFEFHGDGFDVKLGKETGYLETLVVNGQTYVNVPFATLETVQTSKDPWGTFEKEYPAESCRFCLADKNYVNNMIRSSFDNENVRVIEDGSVRTVVEVIYVCGNSRIVAHYSFPKKGKYIDVSMDVFWMESDTLLKMVLPFGIGELSGHTMFSSEIIPNDGKETAFQKYLLWRRDDKYFAVINNCVHGVDWKDGIARMSLIRSACYSSSKVYDLPLTREDAYVDRIDNGVRSYKFRFLFGGSEVAQEVAQKAEIFHKAPFALCYFPSGDGKKPMPLVRLTGHAACSAIKRAQNGEEIVIRLYNPTEKTALGELFVLERIRASYEIDPFSFVTYKVDVKAGKVQTINCLEKSHL